MDNVIAEIFETARRKLTVLLTVFKLVLIVVAFVLTELTRLLTVFKLVLIIVAFVLTVFTRLLTVFKLVLIIVAFVLTAFTRLLTVRNPVGAGRLVSSEPSPINLPNTVPAEIDEKKP